MKVSRIMSMTLTASILFSSTVYSMDRPEDFPTSPPQRSWVKPALTHGVPVALAGAGLGYLSYRGYKNKQAIIEKVKAKKAQRNMPFDDKDTHLMFAINEATTIANVGPKVWSFLRGKQAEDIFIWAMDPDVRSALAEYLNTTPLALFEKIIGKKPTKADVFILESK